MLIEVVSYESINIDDLPVQGQPKDEELTSSNPILTISLRKNMVGSKALELTKYKIANSRSLGEACLIPPPRTGQRSPQALGVIVLIYGASLIKGW